MAKKDDENDLLPEVSDKERLAIEKKEHRLAEHELEEYLLAGKIITSRIHGMNITEIANNLDVKEREVRAILSKHLHRLNPVESLEELRALQMTRYERMLGPQMKKAENGDGKAVRTSLAIMNGINTVTGLNRGKQEEESKEEDADLLRVALRLLANSGLDKVDLDDKLNDIIDVDIVEELPTSSFLEEKQKEYNKDEGKESD